VGPETDVIVANERGLAFYISAKAEAQGHWNRVAGNLSLAAALELSSNDQLVSRAEVGVFVETRSGGILYWSSRKPAVFNSLILRPGYS
jgi:hypothetical protein